MKGGTLKGGGILLWGRKNTAPPDKSRGTGGGSKTINSPPRRSRKKCINCKGGEGEFGEGEDTSREEGEGGGDANAIEKDGLSVILAKHTKKPWEQMRYRENKEGGR